MSTDFRHALRAELLEPDMPAAVEARLRSRLGASIYSRGNRWKYPLVAFAACVAGVLLSFVVTRVKTVDVVEQGNEIVVQKQATLRDAQDSSTLVVSRGHLRHEARGLRVVSGRVELDVDKRAPGAAPMRVLVSHGEIEVHGTRFSVDQIEGGGGAAVLFEGRILFRSDDGRVIELVPGQSIAWPLPPVVAPPSPSMVKPDDSFKAEPEEDALAPLPSVSASNTQPDWSAHDRLLRAHILLERIPKLRADRKPAQAAAELEIAMTEDLPAAARERLSFDLIDILANELWDSDKACRFAKDHAWRYPAGRFDDEIVRIREELGCVR